MSAPASDGVQAVELAVFIGSEGSKDVEAKALEAKALDEAKKRGPDPATMTEEAAFKAWMFQVDEYKIVERCMREVQVVADRLGDLCDARESAADEKKFTEIDEKVDKLVSDVRSNAAQVKIILERMRGENAWFAARYPNASTSAALQMRQNLYQRWLLGYSKAMQIFRDSHNRFIDNTRQGQKRRLHQINDSMEPSAKLTTTQIDEIVDSGRSDQIAKEAFISDDLRGCIDAIELRHKKTLELEANVRGLYEIFKDFATLIDIQQETINGIGEHIQKAQDHVTKGAEALDKAEKHQKCSRTSQCCICVLVVILLLIILIPVLTLKNA